MTFRNDTLPLVEAAACQGEINEVHSHQSPIQLCKHLFSTYFVETTALGILNEIQYRFHKSYDDIFSMLHLSEFLQNKYDPSIYFEVLSFLNWDHSILDICDNDSSQHNCIILVYNCKCDIHTHNQIWMNILEKKCITVILVLRFQIM